MCSLLCTRKHALGIKSVSKNPAWKRIASCVFGVMYMHLPYGFDFCDAHVCESMRIKKKINASTNGNPNTAWPTDCGCLPTLSIGTTKSISITQEHKHSGVWFVWEWDALSLDWTAYKPVEQLPYLRNWPTASCAFVFPYFGGVFFPSSAAEMKE